MEENYAMPCFASNNQDSTDKVMDYLINDLNIEETTGININKEYFILVLKENYSKAVTLGNQYILKNNIKDIFWVDPSGFLEKSGYLEICYMVFSKYRKGNILWGLDENLPKDIYSYLKQLKEYIGVDVFQEYFENDYENGLILKTKGTDYNDYMNKLVKFVRYNGLGPFKEIVPMTKYGAPLKENTNKKKKSKRDNERQDNVND